MGEVKLRDVISDDMDTIFRWQQDKDIRQFSRVNESPTYEEHKNWFNNRISLDKGLYKMIMYNDINVGVLRLDPLSDRDNNSYEVSIFVDKNYQQKGIALDCLNMIREKYPAYSLYAYIDDENTPSQKLFIKAGYQLSNGWYINKLMTDITND